MVDYSSHIPRLSTIATSFSSLHPDLWLVSSEGFHLPANRFLLTLYAPYLSTILPGPSSSPTCLSLPMPALPISLLINLLTNGSVAHSSVFNPLDLLQTAELLGIDLGDIEIVNSFDDREGDTGMNLKEEVGERGLLNESIHRLAAKDETNDTKVNAEIQDQRKAILDENFTEDERNFRCKHCEYSSSQRQSLMKHLRNHRETKYKCTLCEFRSNKHHLKRHIKAKHTDLRYDCKECEFRTPYKKDLCRHFNKKHGTDYKNIQCNQCFYKTSTKRMLEKHVMDKHGKSNIEEPDHYDGQLTPGIEHVKPAMPEFSKQDGEFACLDCPYTTMLLLSMRNHWIIHNPSFYECKICKIKHSSASFLQKHIQENHYI